MMGERLTHIGHRKCYLQCAFLRLLFGALYFSFRQVGCSDLIAKLSETERLGANTAGYIQNCVDVFAPIFSNDVVQL